jgi:hypothetical protein
MWEFISSIITTVGVVISSIAIVIVLPWWLRGKFAILEENDRALSKKIEEGDKELERKIEEGDKELERKIEEGDKELEKKIEEGDKTLEKRLGGKIENLVNIMRMFLLSLRSIHKVQETLIDCLSEAKLMSSQHQIKIYKWRTEAEINLIEDFFTQVEGSSSNNPFSKEELNKLRKYVEWMRQGKLFSVEDAEDFKKLVIKLRREKGDEIDGDVMGLLTALSSLVLGTARKAARGE